LEIENCAVCAPPLLAFLKQGYSLDVSCMREQIHRLHHAELVPASQKLSQIPRKCGRIAADVDNFLGLMGQCRCERSLMETCARRIQDDAVEDVLSPGSQLFMQDVLRIPFVETDVPDFILPGRAQRILNRGSSTLHADDFLRKPCEVLSDCSDATVAIEHGLALGEIRCLRDCLVELLCSERVGLKEGEWRKFEGEVDETLPDVGLTFEHMDFRMLGLIIEAEMLDDEQRRHMRVLPEAHEVLEQWFQFALPGLDQEAEHLLPGIDSPSQKQ